MAPPSDGLEAGYDLFKRYCNPGLALRAELTGHPHRYTHVVGGDLVDRDAGLLQDWISGWGTQAFGHRNPHVVARLLEFLAGDAPTYFSAGVSSPAGHLAARLCERTGFERAWFASGGTEAVEAALKLARAATQRPRVLYLDGAYHGCTFGSVSMMAAGDFRDAFGAGVDGFRRVPREDVEVLEDELSRGDVAAVVVEPIQVEGGVRAVSERWVRALGDLARRYQTLIVADEIQTGVGRTGHFLYSESAWDGALCRPDIVCLGKALGGGLVPISAILTTSELWDRAYGDYRTSESHNSTFTGNGLACTAALAMLELVTDEALERVRERGAALERGLREIAAAFPAVVADVRGAGLLWGIELAQLEHPYLTFDYLGLAELGDRAAAALVLTHRLYRRACVTSVCGHDWNTLRLQPRLDIAPEAVATFLDALASELGWLNDLVC